MSNEKTLEIVLKQFTQFCHFLKHPSICYICTNTDFSSLCLRTLRALASTAIQPLRVGRSLFQVNSILRDNKAGLAMHEDTQLD